MLGLLVAAAAYIVPCVLPDESEPSGKRAVLSGEPCRRRAPTSQLTPAQRQRVSTIVRESLKDPLSATFKWLPYRSGSAIACAALNAKNSMGGYVGYSLFSVHLMAGRVVSVTSPGLDAQVECADAGYVD